MNLKFILGKAQNNKKSFMISKLKSDIKNNPDDRFIWLVPNHIKFESEVGILSALSSKEDVFATNNVQVFSFSRLQWYFLRNDPIYQKPQLTNTTQVMILSKILVDQADNLELFGNIANRPGFVASLQKQINELIADNIVPARLGEFNQTEFQSDLPFKLHDLQLVYQKFLDEVKDKYADSNALMKLLADYLMNDPHQSKIHYYISDFSQFNAQEYQIIQALLLNSASVDISLTLDRAYSKDQTSIFFNRPLNTFKHLSEFARKNQVPISTEMVSGTRVANDLAKLENFWIQNNTHATINSVEELEDSNTIQVWNTTTPQKEIERISTYIRQLVAKQGYRFNDFLILARNLSEYQLFLEPYFQNQEISYFVDLQHSMKDHAFNVLIDTLFALVKNNLQYNDIFKLLKTELIIPKDIEVKDYRMDVDLTENYALANGLHANDWLNNDDFTIRSFKNKSLQQKVDRINNIRHLVKNIYLNVKDIIDNAKNCQQACEQLYLLLTNLNIFDNLKKWEKEAVKAGNISLSQQPTQIVNTFSQLLDEYVAISGNDEFNVDQFLTIIDSGFENAQYSTVPSVLDAVFISEIGMVQNNNRKITIIIGANDINMPKVNVNNNLLSDEDIQSIRPLLNADETIPETENQLNSAEPYLHDVAFLSGKQRLIFSYASTSSEQEMQISPYVDLIAKHFQIKEQVNSESNQNISEKDILSKIGSRIITTDDLLQVYRESKDQDIPVDPHWHYLRDFLFDEEKSNTYFSKIWSGLSYKNIPAHLNENISNGLYENQLLVSISQLETFYKNPYEYFLKYGLNLHKRDEFKITPANEGTFYHAVLDQTMKELSSQNIMLDKVDKTKFKDMTGKVIQQILKDPEYRVLVDNQPFVCQQLIDIATNTLEIIRKQARVSKFDPKKTEVAFGQVGAVHNIKPLEFDLNNKKKLVVRGRIDRIDQLNNNSNYYSVVDYKSGAKNFAFGDLYAGINLQLLTYLDSLKNDPSLLGADPILAGGFYFHVKEPIIKFDKDLKGDLTKASEELFKKYKYRGLIIDDKNSPEQLEPDIGDERSDVYQINRKHIGLKSVTVDGEQFEKMLKYNQKLLINAANKIFNGEDELHPIRVGNDRTVLDYTDYLPIMQFDAMLPENNYRQISSINKDDFFKKINR